MKKYLLILPILFLTFQILAQNYQSAKSIGAAGGDVANSVAVDGGGNTYTIGYFVSTVDFDPGLGTANLTAVGNTDIFILKLDPFGNFVWVKGMGGIQSDQGNALTLDATGNVYATGTFLGTPDFNPGAAVYNMTSAGGGEIFIMSLDPSGNFRWAKQMGGTSNDVGLSIAVDGVGNAYTTGYYRGTADFDPGGTTYNLTSTNISTYDIFISKLDPTGNFLWARSMGGVDDDRGKSIGVDALGNVYTTGFFYNEGDFDPGAAEAKLTTVGYDDIFISKLDASGNFLWAKNIGSTANDGGAAISVDAAGNTYSTGWFSGTADFDPSPGTYPLTSSSYDVYVLKLNPSGYIVWAKNMGGNVGQEGYAIDVDISGNVFTTGYFDGTADFDPGAGIANLSSQGSLDIFVSKLDPSGNFLWVQQMGGTNIDQVQSIVVDGTGNIYTAGNFQGTSDFDPGPGIYNLVSEGYQDIFISKLGASTLPVSFVSITANRIRSAIQVNWKVADENHIQSYEVECSINGRNFTIAGNVAAKGNSALQNYSWLDVSITTGNIFYRIKSIGLSGEWKYSNIVKLTTRNNEHNVVITPNPATNMLLIEGGEAYNDIHVINSLGVVIKKTKASANLNLDISNLPAGQYFLRLAGNAEKQTLSFLKQ